MTADSILFWTSAAGLIALLPSLYFLYIVSRGSIRRALYRMSISPEYVQKTADISGMMLGIAQRSLPTPLPQDTQATISRCIDYYAINKRATERSIIEILRNVPASERRALVTNLHRIGDLVGEGALQFTEHRLTENETIRRHGWLAVSQLQHMAARGNRYYIDDFIGEIKNAISVLERLGS